MTAIGKPCPEQNETRHRRPTERCCALRFLSECGDEQRRRSFDAAEAWLLLGRMRCVSGKADEPRIRREQAGHNGGPTFFAGKPPLSSFVTFIGAAA